MSKTVEEINRKIENGAVRVVTAERMPEIVAELGAERAAEEVDVVTTGTFGAMCSSGAWLNFGHADPPIRMSRVWLNDVEAYAGVAAVDAYLGATQASETVGMGYSGAHVIEDLLRGRPVVLRAVSVGSDCYPRKELLTEVTLAGFNQALLSNPRNAYQRYNAAANSGTRVLHTYMGKLLPGCGNVTFSGAGELSPLMNDPELETIGVGTRIFLGGGVGTVVGAGTQHDPKNGFATLMVQGDLKGMSSEFLRAAVFHGYGGSLYVGIGVPIPVLHAGIARRTAVRDRDIEADIVDYGVPRRERPVLGRFTYEQLKSGAIRLNGRSVPAAPLSSFHMAGRIAARLKEWIEQGRFCLGPPATPLPVRGAAGPLVIRPPQHPGFLFHRRFADLPRPAGTRIRWDAEACFSCGQCLGACPAGVFARDENWRVTADPRPCTGCGRCERLCPAGALTGGDHGR
ncbi:MAG: 4Fe-4S binding protein [Candidatus Aminicenantes bacterium]|nr:4Fe-4S binding protein [Candidatus Aminicenantes bacterium]